MAIAANAQTMYLLSLDYHWQFYACVSYEPHSRSLGRMARERVKYEKMANAET